MVYSQTSSVVSIIVTRKCAGLSVQTILIIIITLILCVKLDTLNKNLQILV